MSPASRTPFVALLTLLQRRFPGLNDPARLIKEGKVLVNGLPAASPRTRVRADAAIRIRHPRPPGGTIKLTRALTVFGVDAAGAVALDLGAAAGGFTRALLDAGGPASTPSTPAPASSAGGCAPTPGSSTWSAPTWPSSARTSSAKRWT